MTKKTTRFVRPIIWLLATGLCAAVLTLAGTYLYLNPQIPPAESYRNVKLETPLRIYSEDRSLLAEFGTRRVVPVSHAEIPPLLINAVLDTEDKRFYSHNGIDLISLLNDVIELALTQKISSGASTITMQLARNISFSLEQTFIRKFKEMLLALKIEQELNKDEILTLYLNVVPFGKRAYGIQAASMTYFGKPLNQLNLPQLAMLAGIPQAPEAGNPVNGPERALRRRNLVLGRMLAQNSISDAEYQAAINTPITAKVHNQELDLYAPYIAEWVRQQLSVQFKTDLYTGGYEVFTTINAKLQKSAIESVRKGLIAYDKHHGYRGAENHYDTGELFTIDKSIQEGAISEPLDTSIPEHGTRRLHNLAGNEQFQSILTLLKDHPTRGGLQAALVTQVNERSLTLLFADGRFESMPWQGMSWARPYVDVDTLGPRPQIAADILSKGDIVRVYLKEDIWQLTQLPDVQGALISLDPDNGNIKALVGGFDFKLNQFNHALQAARQPGSGLKPFVYSSAIANGITPSDTFMDAPLVFNDSNLETTYRPKNDGGRYNGPTRLREALYRSINLVSIRVLLKVGAGKVLSHIGKFGFDTSNFPRNTQLAIGGGTITVTPIEMATAYAVLANEGYLIEPNIITEIRSLAGGTVWKANYPKVCDPCTETSMPTTETNTTILQLSDSQDAMQQNQTPDPELAILDNGTISTPIKNEEVQGDQQLAAIEIQEPIIPAKRVVSKGNVFIVNSMLQDVIRRGTGVRANRAFERKDLSGKTGTTNEADTWFNGYNRDLVTSTWVGFSDGRALGEGEYGSNRPLPIWIDYMLVALKNTPETSREQPEGVVSFKVDPKTGEMARPDQTGAIFEYFLSGNPPKANSGVSGPIDSNNSDQVAPEDIF